jgi:hypothetical protein
MKKITDTEFEAKLKAHVAKSRKAPLNFVLAVRTWGPKMANHDNGTNRACVTIDAMVDVIVAVAEHIGPDVVFLALLEAYEMQGGHGSIILRRLCELADKLSITLALEAFPVETKRGGPKIPIDKLKSFYASFGFRMERSEEHGDAYMFRRLKR